jgi:hypothetical protein
MSRLIDFHGLPVPVQRPPCGCPRERLLPFGTPVVLKRPYLGRTLARVAGWLGGCRMDRYALFFEGCAGPGGTACIVNFNRDEFVLARSGT